jgi:hypothetical protein
MPTLVALFAVGLRIACARYTDFVADDAYITFRYARNLAAGMGFVYNSGQAVLGTTTPLFTLLLAALSLVGIDPVTAARAVSIGCDAGSAILVFLFVRQVSGCRWTALLSSLFWASLGPGVVWAISGMETGLFTFLSLSAFWNWLNRRAIGTAIACSLAILTRPEGVLLTGVLIAFTFLYDRRGAARIGGSVVAFATPWFVYSYWVFGDVVPMSVRAKALLGGTAWSWNRIASDLMHRAFGLDDAFFGLACSGTLITLFPVARVCAWIVAGLLILVLSTTLRVRRCQPLVCFLCVYYFLHTTAVFPFPWYWVPLGPFAAIVIAVGVTRVASAWNVHQSKLVMALVTITTCAAFVMNGLNLTGAFVYYRSYRASERSEWEAAAVWLNSFAPREARVCLEHIGYVGYFADREIIDTTGLVSPEVVRFYRKRGASPGKYFRSKVDLLKEDVARCDYYVAAENDWSAMHQVATPAERVWLTATYHPVSEFVHTGEPCALLSRSVVVLARSPAFAGFGQGLQADSAAARL